MSDDPFKTVKTDQIRPVVTPPRKEPTPAPKPATAPVPAAKAPAPAVAQKSAPAKPAETGTPKPGDRNAAEVCQLFPLGDDAKKLLDDKQAVLPFLHQLIKHKLYADAVRLVAHALPKQEAVWWACRCVRMVEGKETPLESQAALQSAESWVKAPTEENRRAAEAASEMATLAKPAGCAAIAAFWSGGSLAPPNVPVVPPGPTLTAQAVANTVLLAAVTNDPAKAPDKYFKFLAEGIQVANGASKWS